MGAKIGPVYTDLDLDTDQDKDLEIFCLRDRFISYYTQIV